jgi:hypothetical protein
MNRILLAVAAVTAVVCGLLPAHAAYIGNAPWCAVVNLGAGSIEWDCEYPSAAACAPNVIAGNRGFCGINPYYAPPPPYGASHAKRVRRHPYGY